MPPFHPNYLSLPIRCALGRGISTNTPRIVTISSSSRSNTPPKYSNMSVSTKAEAEIKRNPHPDFKKVEDSRPDWDKESHFRYTKTANPSWSFGGGANALRDPAAASKKHISIDPYEPGRPVPFNYKLLISGVVPRPIGFVSTVSSLSSASPSADGKSIPLDDLNLAPFSYFNIISHDPPLFAMGFASTLANPKDTLRNLVARRECVVNIIGEDYVEAANSTSVDAPPGTSEWPVSGLTPVFDTADVKAPRVGEAVFSVECRLESVREFESRSTPGKKTGCLVLLEGTRFWVREDALNEEKSLIDPEVLRPISRLGGITYGRVTEAMEIMRPRFKEDVGGQAGYEELKKKREGGDS